MSSSTQNFVTAWLYRYDTEKVVRIQSSCLALLFRFCQLTILLYIGLWVMWYQKGYQSEDMATSGVTSKVKGISFSNISNKLRVWDTADYVVPPQQNSAFFIMTHMVMTKNQTQTTCPEGWEITRGTKNECETNDDCRIGEVTHWGNGAKTGRCVVATREHNITKRVCEIFGWCPVEDDRLTRGNSMLLREAKNFTVLIKNNIEFPKYGVRRHNILPWMTKQFVQTCLYDPNDEQNRLCPVFRIGDIIKYTGNEDRNIWIYGGIVTIQIKWNCNLDRNEKYCIPQYMFKRLDDPDTPIAKGWNLRYAHMFNDNNRDTRILIKAYGIQFFISVEGHGRKFDVLILTMNIGSGLGLLGVCKVICDLIALNIPKKRQLYRDAKIDVVNVSLNKIQIQQSPSHASPSSGETPRMAFFDEVKGKTSISPNYSPGYNDQHRNSSQLRPLTMSSA